MKMVGTGCRKTSDPPYQSCDALMLHRQPVVPDLCIFHIWKKEIFSRFFGGPTDAVLFLILSSPVPTWDGHLQPGHMTGATTTSLYKQTQSLGKTSYRAKQYLWMQHCVVNPQGKLLPKSIFYKCKPFILIVSLYLYRCFIISIK